jgi:hypothetical protein
VLCVCMYVYIYVYVYVYVYIYGLSYCLLQCIYLFIQSGPVSFSQQSAALELKRSSMNHHHHALT